MLSYCNLSDSRDARSADNDCVGYQTLSPAFNASLLVSYMHGASVHCPQTAPMRNIDRALAVPTSAREGRLAKRIVLANMVRP